MNNLKNILIKSIFALSVLTTVGGVEAQINKVDYTAKAYEDDRALVQDATKSSYNAIVAVGNNGYAGSGFVIGKNTVLTNKHVINHGDVIHVATLATSKSNCGHYEVDKVIPYPGSEDLAVLHVKENSIEPPNKNFSGNSGMLTLNEENNTKVGSHVYTAGYPGNKPRGTMWKSDGTITNIAGTHFVMSLYTSDGKSGSPIYDQQNRVVGILKGGPNDLSKKITTGVFFDEQIRDFMKSNIKQ
ncbi:trypsin-like peptidase domain-containing protein [Staphylococcus saccharolyticus]|uniref:trypsin-like serine peptidase n=1 Tax=Staphylococcus saccharolyticus TaxID=33028 RepID=UPI0032DEAC00